jgi:hypothetical protein
MNKLILAIILVLLLSPSLHARQTTTKEGVKIFNIIPIVSGYEDDLLKMVYYSINNFADKPLEWVKSQIIVRNPDKEIVDTDDTKFNFVKYFGNPLAPGLTKQIWKTLAIRGYCTSRGCGTVEIKLLDFQLVENN